MKPDGDGAFTRRRLLLGAAISPITAGVLAGQPAASSQTLPQDDAAIDTALEAAAIANSSVTPLRWLTAGQVNAVVAGQETFAAANRAAIQQAIAAVAARGGGIVYLPLPGPWVVDRPIVLESNVALVGCSQAVTIRKIGAVTAGGVDAVIYGRDKARFRIENVSVHGTRTGTGANAQAGCHGFYLSGCSYFDLVGSRADYCATGYVLQGCYTSSIQQCTAIRCQGYGFRVLQSSTSLVFRNTTSWGCGGGWSISSSTYLTLDGCACDLSDTGSGPDDRFGDGGGDFRSPGYVFELSAAHGVTINSPGCEICNSQWLYAEGSEATINSPSIYVLKGYSPQWRLIQLRGTANAAITINNPFGFESVALPVPAARAIFIEDPGRQKLFLTGRWRVNAFAGPHAYSFTGIIDPSARRLLDLTQHNMVEGGTPLVRAAGGGEGRILFSEQGKRLNFRAAPGATAVFTLPLPSEGLLFLRAAGGAAAGTRLEVAEPGSGRVLKSWPLAASSETLEDWAYVDSGATPLALRLLLPVGGAATFSELTLTHVGGQR